MPWSPSLSVGIELLDNQHKEWIERAEELFDAGKKNQAREYIGAVSYTHLDVYKRQIFGLRAKSFSRASATLTGSVSLYS